MKNITVCIGANYGDEGKGKTISAFVLKSTKSTAVVRFNGGAQAGHTVVTNGYRHVCSHFGAAVLQDVPTILTSDFVVHPYLFLVERKELMAKGIFGPTLIVSPDCLVSTPWDVMLNQVAERARSKNRHGSVGVGFGETIQRSQTLPLLVSDLQDLKKVKSILNTIVSEYIPTRLRELGIPGGKIGDEWGRLYFEENHNVNLKFIEQCDFFVKKTSLMDERSAFEKFDRLLFEGAQGLALDQNSEDFPFVTRSNTGVTNVVAALKRAGIEQNKVDLYYVTRPYLTRHGAGPLVGERTDMSEYFEIEDQTNVTKEFQGSLRFAFQNINKLADRINADLAKIPSEMVNVIGLSVTCVDQLVGKKFLCILDNKKIELDVLEFTVEVFKKINSNANLKAFWSFDENSNMYTVPAINLNAFLPFRAK